MATCASGASRKGSIPAGTQVLVDRSLWEQVTGASSSWFDFLLEILPTTYIDVDALCALNLDDPVLPSPPNLAAAFANFPSYLSELFEYVRAKLRYAAFAQACVCNSPPAFSCTTLLTHPWSGATSTAVSNDSFGVEFVPSVNTWIYGGYLEFSGIGGGAIQHGVVESGGAALSHIENVPSPATGDATYFFASPQLLLAGHTYKYFYRFPGSGYSIRYDSFNTTPATVSGVYYSQHVYENPAGSGWLPHTPFTTSPDPIFCPPAGTPPIPVVDPAPPDLPVAPPWSCTTIGDVCARLFQMNIKLDWIIRKLDLMPQLNLPLGYVVGTVHSGLTGTGNIVVSGIRGLHVSVTTIPATWGRMAATPPRYIPALATIQVGTSSDLQEATWIHYAEQLIYPVDSAQTEVRYNFRPGVTATVTELVSG
jgi:hypothetical protein